jgi:phage FluMu protein Com
MVRNYVKVAEACINDKIEWEKLSLIDFVHLIINLRAKSKGETITLKRKECGKCKNAYEFDVSIDEKIEYEREKTLKVMHKITDELAIQLVPLRFNFFYEMDDVKTELDLYTLTASHSIIKVIYGKDIHTKFTPAELRKKVINNLTKQQLKGIFDSTKKLISMKMVIQSTCPKCKHIDKDEIKDFLKFLN